MNPMTYLEAVQVLRQAGCTGIEIDRLYRLRQTFQTSELDQSSLDLNRLQFVHWLVITGRLTDHLPEQPKVTPLPQTEKWPRQPL